MCRKNVIILFFVLLLSGCGGKEIPELQNFQGETVATLQTPFSQTNQIFVTDDMLAVQDSGETPQPTQFSAILAPEDESEMIAVPSQTIENPSEPQPPKLTPLASATLQFNLTSTPSPGIFTWEGNWNIWYQNSNGDYTSAVMNVQITGDRLSATADLNGSNYTFNGEISPDSSEVTGKWQASENDGSFWWQMISSTTFVGSSGSRFGFCGERDSDNRPASCRRTPPN